MSSLAFAFWFFLPAGMANLAPVLASRMPRLNRWNTPIDFGHEFRGIRIFGNNKTWRGLLSGIVIASVTVWVQHRLAMVNHLPWTQIGALNYSDPGIIWLGPLLGAGALIGDAVESFFKRRHGVKPGQRWFPFDQTDYIIGGCLFSLLIVRLPFGYYALILIMWASLHVITAYIAYHLKLKDTPI